MKAPFNLEDEFLNAIKNKDTECLLKYLRKTSVILFDEKRYDGERFVKELISKNIYSYTVDLYEVLVSEEIDENTMITQSVYITKITESKDAGKEVYSISSTWKKNINDYELLVLIIQKR